MGKRWMVGFGLVVGMMTQAALADSPTSYTPRSFAADKLTFAIAKLKKVAGGFEDLKAAEAALPELKALLGTARKGLVDARESMRGASAQLGTVQTRQDDAVQKAQRALSACETSGRQLRALPELTPGRDSLVAANDAQCKNLRGLEADLEQAAASITDARPKLAKGEKQLAAASAALDTPMPSLSKADKKQLKALLDPMEAATTALIPLLEKVRKYNAKYGALLPVFQVQE